MYAGILSEASSKSAADSSETAAPGRSRLGVTVSRRIGNAVVRNRVKRRVREAFRLGVRDLIPAGTSIVVIARAGAGKLDFATINSELVTAANNLRGRMRE